MSGLLAIAAIAVAAASGLPGLLLRRRPVLAQRASAAALCGAAVLGVAAAVPVLAGAPPFLAHLPWRQPYASLALRLDSLSALFLLPILVVPALGAVYGLAYWPQERLGPRAVALQLWYGLVAGSMGLVVLADNAMLFLIGWEVMAVCGFFLVRADGDRRDALRASWIYLAAAHVGTFAIFAFFAVAGSARGSFDFGAWTGRLSGLPGAGWLALLALVGFGLKAGLVPLHFWLPGAHAAAPSHVSAVMSGVLLKTGVYGLFRSAGFFEAPPASWGVVVLVLGGASAVLGVALGALGALDAPLVDRVSFAVLVVPVLGLVGALAAACFVKVQGTVFLGNPRTPEAAAAHESPRAMLVPMGILAASCAAIGALPALLVPPLTRGAAAWSGLPLSAFAEEAEAASRSAVRVSGVALVLLAVVGALVLWRRRRAAAPDPVSETWGCGYSRPTFRMAYTGSSFAQILNQGFRFVLFPRVRFSPPRGPFPASASFSTEPREAVLDLALLPAVRDYIQATSRIRGLVAGRLHLQALLVLATLVAMLAWRFLRE